MNVQIADWPWGWRVPSKSYPNATRYVDLLTRTCDCPAGRRKKECRHVRIANEFAWSVWRQVIARMTEGEAGWTLLRQIEGMIEFRK